MKIQVKKILKKSILPLILVVLYIAVIAVLAYFADKQNNGAFFDFNYATHLVLLVFITGPAFLMLLSGLCWIVELVKFKEYRYEKRSLAITSLICGSLFLIGVFAFLFLTLGIL